ncbi:hypothetical protein SAMN05421663_104151 [Terribacillus halophilus]|uniref:Uncharacterized protein n=1 Tax=Terribacillus halophilus TaxID=361279 RepID=A0A1G6PIW0_9BACI|nr:hypothetical protein [Terribacillus halophilus]SDC80182.1 hypothetical protein SAMN05421663_104151 [Terribacillus halophilus]
MFIVKKRKIIVIIGGILLIAGILVYVFQPYFYVKHDNNLEVSLNEKIKEAHSNSISLGDLITYNWKRAYFFHPYSDEADMKKKLGVKFHDPVDMSLRDDIELLVVVKEDGSFEYAKVKLDYGMASAKDNFLTPENDAIEITHP